MSRKISTHVAASGLAIVMTGMIVSGAPAPSSESRAAQPLATLPVAFVENRGQMDSRVRYYAQGAGFGFYLTSEGISLAFTPAPVAGRPDAPDGYALNLQFVGATRHPELAGDRTGGTVNYLRGSNPAGWQTNLARFGAITYRDVWPGVSLRVEEQAGTLKYEFHVAPGADPAVIRLAYQGASSLTLDTSGALLIGMGAGSLRDAPPVSYQTIDGVRTPVESAYVLAPDRAGARVGFHLGAYRSDRELVIDPGIQYATFLGGSSHEIAGGLVADAAGNVFVTGFTQSPDFPTTAGAFRRTGAASNFSDVFVTKMNAAGTALVYSTFIGGSDFDFGRRIAVDAAGNAYVTGQTKSSNFPTTGGAFDRSFNILTCPRCGIDNYDAFALKLNATGSALVYSTFLGGTDIDDAHGIAVDGAGNAYVTGETLSADFPTTAGGFQRTRSGEYDAFVTKLNATGSALVYSTFLGGAAVENSERVAVDAAGRAFVLGFTSSADYPRTVGAFDTTPNGGFDLFVTKLNAAGSGLMYSTLIGGNGFEAGGGLAIDAAGNAYVSGATGSVDFPTTPGAFDPLPDGSDAFALKLNPSGSALVYSTVLGGSTDDGANGIAVDGTGKAWVTGITNSSNFPTTPGAAHSVFSGVADAFVSELSADGSALAYSTYIGGVQSEGGDDIAVDSSTGVYVAGHTYSLDFPVTVGAFDRVFNGDLTIFWGDAFLVKLATNTNVSTPEADAPIPSAPTLLSPFNASSQPQPITFDWGETPGAASYTIQIDDSSAFNAPLVRNIDVAGSMYATTGLSTSVHFWRVRGVNVDGVPGPWSAVRSFTPEVAGPSATLTNLDINPTSIVGGNASSGTVILSVGAPFGGAVVSLSSSNPGVANVPATVTVPDSGFTGTFTISTAAVTVNTTVTITATYNGTTRTGTLAVTSGAGPTVTLQSLVLTQSSIAGGSSLQGVVMLTDVAPSGGSVVALSSNKPGTASVPASVTVPAGSTTAVFAIGTQAVTTSTAVTLSAAYNGTARTATLTVTPASPPPPPPPPPPATGTLTLTVTGRSGVRVTSSPAGVDVVSGSSGSGSFAIGSSITLSVGSGRDAEFSGACATPDKRKSCTFTLSGSGAVTANVR